MKKFFAILTAFSAIAFSCTDGLDPEIYGVLRPGAFPGTEAEYELYTLNLYAPFQSRWGFNEGGTKYTFFSPEEGHVQMFDAPTDLMPPFANWGNGGVFFDAKSRGDFAPLIAQGRDRSHFEKVRLVTKATTVIGDLEKATVFKTEANKKFLLAEAKMARGWTMWFLLQMFGPVPVILDPADANNPAALADMTKPSRQEFINAIVDDLNFAADNLPVVAKDYGRFNKGLALTVLMRLYMNEKDFANAETVGRKILTLGYSLVEDYTSLFKIETERNTETIWAISVDTRSQGRGSEGNFNAFYKYCRWSDYPQMSGWDMVFSATWDFYDSFDPADERRTLLQDSYGTHDRTDLPGAVINKYPPQNLDQTYQGNDIPVARYADVLLMLAEAINENNNGPTQEAIDLVNEVRDRAEIADLSAGDTANKTAFNDAILQERAWELYFEGVRLFDLKRHGKWPSALVGIAGKNAGPATIPIPAYAVSDGVEQNPEYQ